MKTLQQPNSTKGRYVLKSLAGRTSIWAESRYKTKTGEQVIKFPMTDESDGFANTKVEKR